MIIEIIKNNIVPFLTISSILIDIFFTNLIFSGAIFNSYNYWYLLSYSNQLTLHYSILFLIISIIIILFCFKASLSGIINSCYLSFSLIVDDLWTFNYLFYLSSIRSALVFKFLHALYYYFILVFNRIIFVLILVVSY